MDTDQTQKSEQELAFLKESLESEVITKEEYEKGKERIEKKLKDESEEQKTEETKNTQDNNGTEKEPNHQEKEKIDNTEDKKKKKNKNLKNLMWIFVVAAAILFFYFYNVVSDGQKEAIPAPATVKIAAKPTYKYIILTSEECFNCNTERVQAILKDWFPDYAADMTDITSQEGLKIIEELGLEMLPAYIFNETLSNSEKFNEVQQTFLQEKGRYYLSQDAAGSTYYFKRENIENRIDLFVRQGDLSSSKSEQTVKEFIKASNSTVEYGIHLVSDNFAQELGIKSAPSILINNKIKLTGVLPPEKIKQNFCKINPDNEVCNKPLPTNII